MIEPEMVYSIEESMMIKIPRSYGEAMKLDPTHWEPSIQSEINSLKQLQCIKEVTRTPDMKLLHTHFVFKVKLDANNNPIRYKTRLVVNGNEAIKGVDYDLTFSPVVRFASTKLLLCDAARNDKEVKTIDVKTAFLNAKLLAPIYVYPPKGLYPAGSDIVWIVHGALYGHPESPRLWNEVMDKTLKGIGYSQCLNDVCVYYKKIGDQYIYIGLYVDDNLITYHKSIEKYWLDDKNEIMKRFDIDDIGDCKWILNMSINRDRINKTITISQQAYIEKALATFDFNDNKSYKDSPNTNPNDLLPTASSLYLGEQDKSLFHSIIGTLLYAANTTRIDIAYMVNVLSKYVQKPTNLHLQAAKKILRYLAKYPSLGLTFNGNNTNGVAIYADASHKSELPDLASRTGYIVTYHSTPILWRSVKQRCIATSSCEAEFVAIADSLKEYIWFFNLLTELHLAPNSPPPLLSDSESAIKSINRKAPDKRMRHVRLQYSYIVFNTIKDKMVSLQWISTKHQLADLLTKNLPSEQFKFLLSSLLQYVPN
jgi:hypothetical protein